MRVTLRVNDTSHELESDPRLTLLDALRGAAYHATGKRIRSLPISIEKVLE